MTANPLAMLIAQSTTPAFVAANYAALRAYTGLAVLAIVNDVANPETNGFFTLQSTGTENGGTILAGSGSNRWHRYRDAGDPVHVGWWPIGGVDWSGQAYNLTTGAGIIDAADQFTAAFNVGGNGTTVVGNPSTIYTLKKGIKTGLGKNLMLSNVELKRADTYQTTTTAIINAGATSIPVADASGFTVGERITILYVGGANAGKGQGDQSLNFAMDILSISGNTLTIGSPGVTLCTNSPANFPVGSKVVRVNNLITIGSGGPVSTLGIPKLERCRFDGNKAGNDHTYVWQLNASLTCDTTWTEAVYIDDCESWNTPCENFLNIPNGSKSERCRYSALNGSFQHFSDAQLPGSSIGKNIISQLDGDGSNLQYLLSGHSEGLITYSSNTRRLRMIDCNCKNGSAAIVGNPNSTSLGLEIHSSQFETFNGIFQYSTASADVTFDGVDSKDNVFKNCGSMIVSAKNLPKGLGARGVRISDCEMLGDTRMWFNDVAELSIDNLLLRFDDTVTFTSALSADPAAISIQECDRTRIGSIVMEGPKTYNAYIRQGITFRNANAVRRDGSGNSLFVAYPQMCTLQDVFMQGFLYGITVAELPSDVSYNTVWTRQFMGWRWDNITVIGYPDTSWTTSAGQTRVWDVMIPPGCDATNITCIARVRTNGNYTPIIVAGVNNTTGSGDTGPANTKYRGAFLDGWRVFGRPLLAISSHHNGSAAVSYWNSIVKNGFSDATAGPASDGVSAFGPSAGNNDWDAPVKVNNATLMTALGANYVTPFIHQYLENAANYP